MSAEGSSVTHAAALGLRSRCKIVQWTRLPLALLPQQSPSRLTRPARAISADKCEAIPEASSRHVSFIGLHTMALGSKPRRNSSATCASSARWWRTSAAASASVARDGIQPQPHPARCGQRNQLGDEARDVGSERIAWLASGCAAGVERRAQQEGRIVGRDFQQARWQVRGGHRSQPVGPGRVLRTVPGRQLDT